MPTNLYNLKNFIELLKGKREVGLVIAKDDAELNYLHEELANNNLVKSESYKDLFTNKLSFFNLKSNTPKEFIKYILEYPTGAVGLHAKKTNNFKWFYPNYENQVFILTITEEELKNLKEINILEYVSSIYREQKIKV